MSNVWMGITMNISHFENLKTGRDIPKTLTIMGYDTIYLNYTYIYGHVLIEMLKKIRQ